jgi:hypothetical protein
LGGVDLVDERDREAALLRGFDFGCFCGGGWAGLARWRRLRLLRRSAIGLFAEKKWLGLLGVLGLAGG